MSKKPTKHRKYPSKYRPGTYINNIDYIVELICEKIAIRSQIKLVWENNYWQKIIKNQQQQAKKLLKFYEAQIIIAVVKSEEGKNIYSLGEASLLKLLEKQQKKIDFQHSQPTIEAVEIVEAPRQPTRKNNMFNKLRD